MATTADGTTDPWSYGRPSWVPDITEYRTPGQEWGAFLSQQQPFWSTRAPMRDVGENLMARYMLSAPYMAETGASPTFTQYIGDYPQTTGAAATYPEYGFQYGADPAQALTELRRRAGEAAQAAVEAPGQYLSGETVGTPEWNRRAWLAAQFGEAAGAQASAENQRAVANLLALRKPEEQGGGMYRGQMASAIRGAMARMQQHRINTGAPSESFLDWYLTQTGSAPRVPSRAVTGAQATAAQVAGVGGGAGTTATPYTTAATTAATTPVTSTGIPPIIPGTPSIPGDLEPEISGPYGITPSVVPPATTEFIPPLGEGFEELYSGQLSGAATGGDPWDVGNIPKRPELPPPPPGAWDLSDFAPGRAPTGEGPAGIAAARARDVLSQQAFVNPESDEYKGVLGLLPEPFDAVEAAKRDAGMPYNTITRDGRRGGVHVPTRGGTQRLAQEPPRRTYAPPTETRGINEFGNWLPLGSELSERDEERSRLVREYMSQGMDYQSALKLVNESLWWKDVASGAVTL